MCGTSPVLNPHGENNKRSAFLSAEVLRENGQEDIFSWLTASLAERAGRERRCCRSKTRSSESQTLGLVGSHYCQKHNAAIFILLMVIFYLHVILLSNRRFLQTPQIAELGNKSSSLLRIPTCKPALEVIFS